MVDRTRVLVALVLPRPVADEVDGLRRALGSHDLGRIAPHVTLVPPHNLALDRRGELDRHLHAVASRRRPVVLSLGPAATFEPRREVFYLSVTSTPDDLGELASELAAGPLAPPSGRPRRAFVPHVTLARLQRSQVDAAAPLLSGYRAEVGIDALTLMDQDLFAPGHPWGATNDVRLGRPATIGRGGRELVFHLSHGDLSPAEEPEHLVVLVEHDGRRVGFGRLFVGGEALVVETLEVVAGARGEGIGRALLGFVERVARERGLRAVVLDGRCPAFLEACGYLQGPLGPERRLGAS